MVLQLIVKGACTIAGVTALAAGVLYALWAIGVKRGKVLVIRSDNYFFFRIVCLVSFLIIVPVLFVYLSSFPGTWATAALLLYHLASLGQQMFSPLYVSLYNMSEEEALLSVRRALVLAGMEFREQNNRFVFDDEPVAEVVFGDDKPEGSIHLLRGGSLPLYRIIAASCMSARPTPGASALPFLLSTLELLCVGAGALALAFFSSV